MVAAVNGNQPRLLPFGPGSPLLPPLSFLLVMSKVKERKRKREGKRRERETGDDAGKVSAGFTGEGRRGGWWVWEEKKKGNLGSKYATSSECIKNI